MTKARVVLAIWGATATAGVALVTVALAAAVTRVDLAAPSLGELAAACRRWLLPHADPVSLVVLATAGLGAATIIVTWRSAARQLQATRTFERTLGASGRLPGLPDVGVVNRPTPEAFCIGLLRPRIYVSAPAVAALSRSELAAVIAHERHHARRRDPLRLLVARSIGDGLFWLPVLRHLADRYAVLAELAADDAARRASGGSRHLASALLAFDAHPSAAGVGISPQRVDHLMGARIGWELPTLLLAGGAATLAGLSAVAVRLVEATDHAALPLPVVVAQLCMVAMALVPVAAAVAGTFGARRLARAAGRGHTSRSARRP